MLLHPIDCSIHTLIYNNINPYYCLLKFCTEVKSSCMGPTLSSLTCKLLTCFVLNGPPVYRVVYSPFGSYM